MREAQLTRRILKALNATPHCYAIKQYGGPHAIIGTPDIIGCYRSRMFCIEVKAPKGKLSSAQMLQLTRWESADAYTCIARKDFSVREFLEAIGEI